MQGELRLFHLNIHNNKFNPEEMKKFLYRNIGDYVFSRTKIQHFKVNGDAYAIVSQVLTVLQKNGGANLKDMVSELGELLMYSFLEEKLNAPKLMSRVELTTDAKQYASACDGIYLISGISGLPYH
ncbi:Hachiman antiphage defense system protein HamA [Anaerostipes butyraticus]|uniref:Hachiman antiphage defense system protein HamA n=1 Tax=Anaerostipes butyraticus TaxID=645466 RepID=UPI00320B836D